MNTDYVIFDEEGTRYELPDLNPMIDDLLDIDLEGIYKATKYFNELEKAKAELIELGFLNQVEGEEYNLVMGDKSVDILGQSLLERIGEEEKQLVDNMIDMSWKETKPDMEKYRKRKEEEK